MAGSPTMDEDQFAHEDIEAIAKTQIVEKCNDKTWTCIEDTNALRAPAPRRR